MKFAINSIDAPVTIITSRGSFKQIEVNSNNVEKGAYVISDSNNKYKLTIMATGSEVATAMNVQQMLKNKRIDARVVSVPCLEVFEKQNRKYIKDILGNKPIVSIEFGATSPWYKYVDLAVGIDEFGRSGNAKDVINFFKLTPQDIVKKIINSSILKKKARG